MSNGPSSDCLERAFVYATIWSLGSFLDVNNKSHFDRWWRLTFNTIVLPEDGVLWDYILTPNLTSLFLCNIDPAPISSPARALFIPTVQAHAFQCALDTLLQCERPVFVNGPAGSGKTALLLNTLEELCTKGESKLLHLCVDQATSAQSLWKQVSVLNEALPFTCQHVK